MTENHPTGVVAAFEMLLEEIEMVIDSVNRVGARAFEIRDYEKAKEALERAAQVTKFRDKTDALRREWSTLFGQEDDSEGSDGLNVGRYLGRLRRGLRTQEGAFYRPILEALEALGGSAQVNQVLDHVLLSMKGILKDVDYEPLPSEPDIPRWKNTAQWARNSMVKNGLLRKDSPRGIWQISDAGIRYLRGESSG